MTALGVLPAEYLLDDLTLSLLVGSAVLLISVVAVRVSVRSGLPSLFVFLAIGLVLGVALAWAALRLVFAKLDPLPNTPPDPLLRGDVGLVGVCALVALAVAVVVTLVVERRSTRSSLPELLRAAR